MDETRIIRGRKVVFERRDPVETLRLRIDVFDEGDNLVEVLGRIAISPPHTPRLRLRSPSIPRSGSASASGERSRG